MSRYCIGRENDDQWVNQYAFDFFYHKTQWRRTMIDRMLVDTLAYLTILIKN